MHRCDRGFTLSTSSPTTHVFADLPVCPTCGLHSCTKKGQGCWRNALCLALLTCEPSRTQRQTTELWGKTRQLFVFCGCCCFWCPKVSLSLVSHAWRCLKVELRHHGGEMRRFFCFQLLWLFLLTFSADEQDRALTVRGSALFWERLCSECVCICTISSGLWEN